MIAPKIIYACNHVYSTVSESVQTRTMVYSGVSDTIDVQGRVDSVLRIYDPETLKPISSKRYEVEGNKIHWNGSPMKVGDTYNVCFILKQSKVNDYTSDPNLCYRCAGNGWYVSVMNALTKSYAKSEGINKLVQEFIKLLFTQKQDDGYGTHIHSYYGKTMHDENILISEICAEISDAESQFKLMQIQSINNDIEIPPSEMLEGVSISSAYYDKDRMSVVIQLLLINQDSQTAGLVFKF